MKVKRVARSVYLPEGLNRQLGIEAARRGHSANDLIIMALGMLLTGSAAPAAPPSPSDDIPPDLTAGDEGVADF